MLAPSVMADAALMATMMSKRYGRSIWALRDVTVDVPTGGITALVGPNAAGKSTLMRAWVGFERPTSGQVRVAGIDPFRSPERALAKVAYVPQRPELYRDLGVADNIAYAAYLRPTLDIPSATEYVSRLGIPTNARLSQLSGGQVAQVVLAVALASGADILILDEPLASLDPLARHEVLELLRGAAASRGLTVLLSSHVVSDVEQASDHLIVLGVGQVLLSASTASAQREHSVVADATSAPSTVAQLPGRNGWLVRGGETATGRRATIEEIVLGYLTRGRSKESQAA